MPAPLSHAKIAFPENSKALSFGFVLFNLR